MSLAADNPFALRSTLPYELPPFASIDESHYLPAFEEGMAVQRAEIEAIAARDDEATFENTLDALEQSGELLARVSNAFFNLLGSSVTDGLRAVEDAVIPRLTAHKDAISMHPGLFARLSSLPGRTASAEEPPPSTAGDGRAALERQRLLERRHLDMVRAGAALGEAEQSRLREINAELARLGTRFRNQLTADTNDLAVHVESRDELTGLSEDAVAAARAAAESRGLDGYLVTLVLPTRQPALAVLRDRALRRQIHEASVSRGRRGNDNDTRPTLSAIVALRAERAALLGFASHAEYVVADQTAGSVGAVMEMLTSMLQPVLGNVARERHELTGLLETDGFDGPLQPWDWSYYEERLARQRFDRDAAALRPWFELDRVVGEGVFGAAEGLYGLTFAARPDLVTYDPDVVAYEVSDAEGKGVGLFLADWYARDAKRGGAWMSSFVDQSHLLDQRPVIVINLNVPRPPDGMATLLTLDEVGTAFHEFGHVLHGLLSDVNYPRLSGTSVPRDFVEYPSQVNEMWAWAPDLLARYAVHHETGEPLPDKVAAGVLASQAYGQGYATAEILAAMLVDQAWHQRPNDEPPVPADKVEDFEHQALERFGLALPDVPPRYSSSYFAHIFAGGYSAGYYSYLWSEVLDADTVDWFEANGGLRRESGEIFRRELLSRGGAVDPMAAFEAVLGRPPQIEPLLKRRGLAPAQGS